MTTTVLRHEAEALTGDPLPAALLRVIKITNFVSPAECDTLLAACNGRFKVAIDQIRDSRIEVVEKPDRAAALRALVAPLVAAATEKAVEHYGDLCCLSKHPIAVAFVISLRNTDAATTYTFNGVGTGFNDGQELHSHIGDLSLVRSIMMV